MREFEYFDEDRTISIKDMCHYLKRNILRICVGSFVICLLFLSYKFIKFEKEIRVDTAPGATLTDDQKDDVKDIYTIYKQTLITKELLLSKAQNSAMSQINPGNAYGIVSSYSIEADLNNPLDYYSTIINFSNEERQEIISNSDFRDNTTNLEDLVSVNVNKSSEEVSKSGNGSKIALVVSVYSDSEVSCMKIQEILEAHIQAMTSSIGASFQKLDTALDIDTSYITNKQVKLSEDLNSISTKLNELKNPNSLNETEKSYYEYLLKGKETNLAKDNSFNFIKNTIIGIGIGVVLLIILFSMLYMFSDKVHATEDFEAFGLAKLGSLNDVNSMNFMKANLSAYIKQHNLSKLFLNVDCENSISKARVLKEKLDDMEVEVVIGNVIKNNNDLEMMLQCDSVLLIETAEKSLIEDVKKIMQIIDRQGILPVGYVVLK
ncbi:hypothetical protein [uncultured Eubacterium sp.]|uniref:hypothetical protein n=1 Tax=uncultured Eubacterium sp. TaxID=165185 RepID=UPI0032667547